MPEKNFCEITEILQAHCPRYIIEIEWVEERYHKSEGGKLRKGRRVQTQLQLQCCSPTSSIEAMKWNTRVLFFGKHYQNIEGELEILRCLGSCKYSEIFIDAVLHMQFLLSWIHEKVAPDKGFLSGTARPDDAKVCWSNLFWTFNISPLYGWHNKVIDSPLLWFPKAVAVEVIFLAAIWRTYFRTTILWRG